MTRMEYWGEQPASSKTNKELWSTSIYHTHDSEDISGVLSVMIRGCKDYIARNTSGIISLQVTANDTVQPLQ